MEGIINLKANVNLIDVTEGIYLTSNSIECVDCDYNERSFMCKMCKEKHKSFKISMRNYFEFYKRKGMSSLVAHREFNDGAIKCSVFFINNSHIVRIKDDLEDRYFLMNFGYLNLLDTITKIIKENE